MEKKFAEVMQKPGVAMLAEECGKFDHTCVLCPEIDNGVSCKVFLRLPGVQIAWLVAFVEQIFSFLAAEFLL